MGIKLIIAGVVLFFANLCGQACDIEWPMPDRAVERKGGAAT